MARYRKCPRPCAQGNSCKWMHKMLQQVPPLKCPYFLKNISSFMLWRPSNPCPRLELPADFVQRHSDKFTDMVEVRGPCKSTWHMRVNILMQRHRRVMLDWGWRTLVNDLGLRQGDHILFVLTAFSKFKVYIFDDVGIRRRLSSLYTMQDPSCIWKQAPWERERDEREEDDDAKVLPVPPTEPWTRRLREKSVACKPVVVELSDDNNCQERSDSEYTLKGSKKVQLEESDSFQSSHRSAFRKSAARLVPPRTSPSFIKKVPAISLKNETGINCAHLEVPGIFTQRYERLFKEYISLQGPTGRVWHVRCQITVQHNYKRVKLKAGWFDFAVDNMVKLHDQLLFTYVAEGQFRVQIVTKGHRPRGRPRHVRPGEGGVYCTYLPHLPPPREQKVQDSPRGHCMREEIVHEGSARMDQKDQTDTPGTPTSDFQQPDINKDTFKSRISLLQQQLLTQRKTLNKVEERYTSRRGRMEWGLGHS